MRSRKKEQSAVFRKKRKKGSSKRKKIEKERFKKERKEREEGFKVVTHGFKFSLFDVFLHLLKLLLCNTYFDPLS